MRKTLAFLHYKEEASAFPLPSLALSLYPRLYLAFAFEKQSSATPASFLYHDDEPKGSSRLCREQLWEHTDCTVDQDACKHTRPVWVLSVWKDFGCDADLSGPICGFGAVPQVGHEQEQCRPRARSCLPVWPLPSLSWQRVTAKVDLTCFALRQAPEGQMLTSLLFYIDGHYNVLFFLWIIHSTVIEWVPTGVLSKEGIKYCPCFEKVNKRLPGVPRWSSG